MDDLGAANEFEVAKRISRVIFEHAARISRESEIFKLLELNADLARDLTGADRCSVWLLDEASGEVWTRVAHGMSEIRIPKGVGIVGACIAENRSVIVNKPDSDERFLRSIDQASGFQTQSVLAVPLRADGRVIGAMQILNKPGGFSNYDVEILRFMALYSASEIQSEKLRQEAEAARLLRRELELAREVQQNLLPQELTPVAGLQYEGFSRPAKSVGGDYYDFLELPRGLFSLTLGDVSGKGLPAAVLMASIQMLLRSHLLRQALPISKLVDEVSHTLYRCSSIDRYSTLFCAVLDAGRKKLTYVNAGHPPPMVLRGAGGDIERLNATGMPIGMLPSSRYSEETIDVEPGDLILCISDGVTEATDAYGGMFEEDGVEKVILRHRKASPADLVAALVKRVDEYSAGTDQYDDITMTAVRIAQ
jgi:sigma-B regulation protein RsbU (phosphoserine phosphatase)